MINSFLTFWYTTVSVKRKRLVCIICLNDLPNFLDCPDVLILWSQIMQRIFALGISIRRSIVDSSHQRNTPTSSQIIKESRPIKKFKFLHYHRRAFFALEWSFWIFFKISDSDKDFIQKCVTFVENCKSELGVFIVVAQNIECMDPHWNIEISIRFLFDTVCSRHFYEISIFHLPAYLKPDPLSLLSCSEEALREIVNLLPPILYFASNLRFILMLATYYKYSSLLI